MKVSISIKIELVWNSMRQGPAGQCSLQTKRGQERGMEGEKGCGSFPGSHRKVPHSAERALAPQEGHHPNSIAARR